jgi:hypothetical protein
MRSREKSHLDRDKEIVNYRGYDASCTLTSLPVLELQNFTARFLLQSEAFLSHELDDLNLNTEITSLYSQMITLQESFFVVIDG